MVIKELLKLLIRVVDAKLFKRVGIKDLETCNVQHTNKLRLAGGAVQHQVDPIHQPPKCFLIHGLAKCSNLFSDLLLGTLL